MNPRTKLPATRRDPEVPLPSRRLLAYFHMYLRWYMPRAFHCVRLSHPERFPQITSDSRTIVCLDHPSWWDPLLAMIIARRLAPAAHHYAPMEASALRRYGFMRQLGLFPLNTQSPSVAAQFLRTADLLLSGLKRLFGYTGGTLY
jgi:1-acyl-sn-glycerol-3-phosphate acyltransferase